MTKIFRRVFLKRSVFFAVFLLSLVTSLSIGFISRKPWLFDKLFFYAGNLLQRYRNNIRNFSPPSELPLKLQATAKGLFYGAAVVEKHLKNDSDYADKVSEQCGILVPEWELKWGVLRPDKDTFSFSRSDWLLEFALSHQMLFRGHTLVWHKSMPDWVFNEANPQNAGNILFTHIEKVVGRYSGKVHSWDVVNEAVEPHDGRNDGLRNSIWLQNIGSDYIPLAFEAAFKADSNALLTYNDFWLEYDTEYSELKRHHVLELLRKLISDKVPIHAMGIQAHLVGDAFPFSRNIFKEFLSDIANLGLKIIITELDVACNVFPGDIADRDRQVAAAYEDYLSVALEEPAVMGVLTWGLSDRYTWLSTRKPRDDKKPVRPLPLDDHLNRKLAWNALSRAFHTSSSRQHSQE
jgi:endo-1,4-beta-xylanase